MQYPRSKSFVEIPLYAVFVLVSDYRCKVDVFNALEDILRHAFVLFFKLAYERFYLFALAVVLARAVGELARAPEKFQPVIIAPRLYIPFAD